MNLNHEEIERLSDELFEHYDSPDLLKARQIAEQLATLLGEPTLECIRRYVHSWILIWEIRGNFEEAIRLQNLDIVRKRAEIESGDYDANRNLISEEIEYLQDSLYLQASRYEKVGKRQKAIECLREVFSLAEQYEIGPDEDSKAMYTELTTTASETNG